MWKKLVPILVIVALASIFAAKLGAPQPGSERLLAAAAVNRTFDVQIVESGVLEALDSVTLSSQIPSNRAKIMYIVPEGTQVDKGEVVIRFDPTPFEEELEQFRHEFAEAKAAYDEKLEEIKLEEARAQQEIAAADHKVRLAELQVQNVLYGEGPVSLEEARVQSIQAKTKMEDAQRHVRDLEPLFEEGFVNADEINRARNVAEEAKVSYQLATMRYETQRDFVYPAEQERAQAELAQARNERGQLEMALTHRAQIILAAAQRAKAAADAAEQRMNRVRSELAKTVITAPNPGFVVYRESNYGGTLRKPQVGDSVWMNHALVFLPDVSKMIVESRVREIDINKLSVGQSVAVTVDAYPDPVHTGKVDHIGGLATTDPRTKSAAKYFDIRVLLDGTDQRLRPGMSCRIAIHVASVEGKLAVPVDAVFREGARTFCYVWDGRETRVADVRTGLTDGVHIVIENGLQEGDRVLLTRPAER